MIMNGTHETSYQDAINQALREEMARDPSIFIMGQDVGDPPGGSSHTTSGLEGIFGADRVITTPLTESATIGAAVGAALMGFRPVVELPSIESVAAAFHQIVDIAAKLHWRTGGAMYAPVVIRGPGSGGAHGGPWQSQSVEAWFTHVPGLRVVTPTTPYDAKGLLKAAIRDNNPVLFLEQRLLYRRLREVLPEDDFTVPLGLAEVRRVGEQLSIITYGATVYHALDAAEQLAEEGIEAEVIDLRSLAPLDIETIRDSVSHTNKALIVHEDTRTGGFGAEIAARLAEELFQELDGPVVRVAAIDAPYPYAPSLAAEFAPDAQTIATAARKLAAY